MAKAIWIAIKIILIVVIPIGIAYFTYTSLWTAFFSPADPEATETILFELAPDSSFKQVCKDLETAGLVASWWAPNYIARIQRSDKQIKAGEYELSAALTPSEIVRKFARGEMYQRRVTIVEGASIWGMGMELELAGVVSQHDFERAAVDAMLTQKAGIAGSSFEGYLFPETYFFSRPITAEAVIFRMLEEGNRHWTKEFALRAEDLQMSRHQILTLASIIEKETRMVRERPLVSSVFHNRLQIGMKLQADPTVVYAIPDLVGSLTRAHLEVDSPYNTYVNLGLPPGPICNPGLSSIAAALYPAETEYLYFVADGGGGHHFAQSLSEHNRNVRRYRTAQQQQNPAKP